MDDLQISPFQERVLSIPEAYDIFLGGGRGGAKSYVMALLILRHVEQYKEKARVLFLRQSNSALSDFELVCHEVFGQVYGRDARYNSTFGIWRFPNGGQLELNQLESDADYAKYQGHSYTLLLVDEVGQYSTSRLLDLMRSNLRAQRGIPLRTVLAANPGGAGHWWLARRFVFKAAPWVPFQDEHSKRDWVYAPSTYRDNPFIDQEQYLGSLRAACSTDPELLRAWADGDWAVNRGAFFAAVLEESRVAVGPFTEVPRHPNREKWNNWLSHDWGSTSPSVTYLMCESPGGKIGEQFFPRGSIIVLDELASYDPNNLSAGLGWTVPMIADAIKTDLCKRWDVYPSGVADDACFSNQGHSSGSLAEDFRRSGVHFNEAHKLDRISGWQKMKRMLADAGKLDVPGLYVSRDCQYFWQTVPNLERDLKRIEDVRKCGTDHGADACRYGILRNQPAMSINIGFAR